MERVGRSQERLRRRTWLSRRWRRLLWKAVNGKTTREKALSVVQMYEGVVSRKRFADTGRLVQMKRCYNSK
jgi:hypothetical protein